MIAIEDVSKRYRRLQVLDGLTCEIRPGAVTLLVGANGCGKTTTLRLVAGLSAADSGRITIDGHDARAEWRAARAAMAFLPQSPRFHPHITTASVLAFYATLRNLSPSLVERAVDRWGLRDHRHVPTGRLSGGLRQRLALAVLFLPDAPVIVLDEPGLSLDPDWRRVLQEELRAAARRGRTVLVSTHLLGEWDDQVDRCLVLEGGRVSRELPPDRLGDAFPFAGPGPRLVSAV